MSSNTRTIAIRLIQPSDWSPAWSVLKPIFRAGQTYAFSPQLSEAEAYQVWVENPQATYVAVEEESGQLARILGTYYIKPNQPALGAHVCNCGYAVDSLARGRGIGALMCEHSQQEAIRLGFRAMQFNLVVTTNQAAIYLWHKLGFETVGTLPGAFDHAEKGLVDALVMYKVLRS